MLWRQADAGLASISEVPNGIIAVDVAPEILRWHEDSMSIFGKIKDAIFGRASSASPSGAASAQAAPGASAAPGGSAAPSGSTAPAAGSAAPAQSVDVAAVLEGLAASNPQKLNWRTSIVDLMKLLDLDSSLANRKELAGELGYSGDTGDSAAMNIWLHKQVMIKLAENGGKVPDDLKG